MRSFPWRRQAARPLAGRAARVNLVTVRVHVESIDLALSIKAKGDKHGKFLGMERVLPTCSKNVVVPVCERGNLTAAVLESQRIGLEPHLDIELESVSEHPAVSGEWQTGCGVGQARGLEFALLIGLP